MKAALSQAFVTISKLLTATMMVAVGMWLLIEAFMAKAFLKCGSATVQPLHGMSYLVSRLLLNKGSQT